MTGRSQDAAAVADYIAATRPETRRREAKALDALFRDATGFGPRLWSGRMIGCGYYDYTYKSGHSGTALATGFAVAARQLTIYIMPGYAEFPDILARLGPHRLGKSCLYVTRLDKVDQDALRDLILAGLRDLSTHWPVKPT